MKSISTFVVVVIIAVSVFKCTYGQTLYSAVIHWMPTGKSNEMQFFYHLSWKQQTVSCTTPACLKVYTISHINVQTLGRWAGYTWSCSQGCASPDVISDLSNLMFAEVAGYQNDNWETGEEIIKHTFSSGDNTNVRIGFGYANGTLLPGLGEGYVNLATRNDTNRPNISPVVAVMPIYRVPLGCDLNIDLSPFDGDGDNVRCRWSDVKTNSLPAASLNEATCKISISATSANGFVSNGVYIGSLYLEDYSESPVQLTHKLASTSTGPFSKSPVMFTVHVGPSSAVTNACASKPSFSLSTTPYNRVRSLQSPFSNTSVSFMSSETKDTMITAGPQGMLFTNTTSPTESGKLGTWSVTNAGKMIVRACALLYSKDGIAGESQCETLLVGDTDECHQSSPCGRGRCVNLWEYYVCIHDENVSTDTDSNLGLVVGLPVGLFAILVAMVIAIGVYLRRLWTRTQRVASEINHTEKEH